MYHLDDLIEMMLKYLGHNFNKLSILHNRELLDVLKGLVTIEPTEGVMDQAYGVPPHVNHARQLTDLCDKMIILLERADEQHKELAETVGEAIEKKAWESGHISGDRLKLMLDDYRADLINTMGGGNGGD